jgi:hypothetical protein
MSIEGYQAVDDLASKIRSFLSKAVSYFRPQTDLSLIDLERRVLKKANLIGKRVNKIDEALLLALPAYETFMGLSDAAQMELVGTFCTQFFELVHRPEH